jgi:two-component system response regulator FixJ
MAISSGIIAIVDDDSAVRDSVQFLLETEGFSVETFQSAQDFLERFRQSHERFSCLIVDHHMPDVTGLDLVSRLRADGHSISVMLITAGLTPAISRTAAEIGIEKVLAKPVSDDELVAFASKAEGQNSSG